MKGVWEKFKALPRSKQIPIGFAVVIGLILLGEGVSRLFGG